MLCSQIIQAKNHLIKFQPHEDSLVLSPQKSILQALQVTNQQNPVTQTHLLLFDLMRLQLVDFNENALRGWRAGWLADWLPAHTLEMLAQCTTS